MKEAIREATAGIENGDGGPFGAVIVRGDEIVGRGHNMVTKSNNVILHGEMVAIQDACKNLDNSSLFGCDIYTTGEPCPMCLGALLWANIRNIYYGCSVVDNESIGFRDDVFDKILNVNRTKIKNMKQIDREECLALYEKYRHLNKKRY